MGNRIPDEIVDQVQKSADIVEVIGDYVQLKKQGRNYFGLCPFHGESSTSKYVLLFLNDMFHNHICRLI